MADTRVKVCCRCKASKPVSEFSALRAAKDGLSYACRSCNKAYGRAHRVPRDPSAHRAYLLKAKYGITLGQYEKMLGDQGSVCAICKQPETRRSKHGNLYSLSVDHDHTCCPGVYSCGKCLRGLLCYRCNYGIGTFVENVDTLQAAIDYIRSH